MPMLSRQIFKKAFWEKSFMSKMRGTRMHDFVRLVAPPRNAKILDLGGTIFNWNLIKHDDYDITLVNLLEPEHRAPGFHYTTGDATDLKKIFADKSFDIAFSNSVIEHVGDEPRQLAFAQEVQRIGKAWWVQTPSDRFPFEPHTRVPFYWKLPEAYRRHLMRKWTRKRPAFAADIKATRVLNRERMTELFPGSEVYTEHLLGFEKSYSFYKKFEP
jgi:hypothetical protein